MAEIAPPSTPQSTGNALSRLSGWVQNPVTIKELRSRMRGRRAFAVLTLYLIFMSGIITLVYLAYVSGAQGAGSSAARTAGKGLFAAVLGVQVFLVVFIGPAFTAGAISGERERQTYDLLRTTLLSPESFVLGKLISALSYVFLLVIVSIPLQSIAFLLGGLSLSELVLAELLVVVAAVTYALYGLFCSATMRSTLAATVTTFGGTLFITVGLPLIVFAGALVVGTALVGPGPTSAVFGAALLYGGLLLAALNLPATLIVSEIILLEENSLLFFSQVFDGTRVWFISPWPLFILIHVLAAVIFYVACVRRVRRVSEV